MSLPSPEPTPPPTGTQTTSPVGDRIRKRRQELGLTQERVAKDADMSKGFLSEVETGTRKPSAEYLLRISNALHVSLDFLMKGDGESPSETGRLKVQIPASLSDFALANRLPFDVVKSMLDAKLRIIANRRDSTEEDLEKFNWAGFYEAMKEYL